ncbi:hypothetical protein [Trebonia kvetii]|uniref:hypothetical protein n=1 Tax=Trebonia kvetii TaxID=2480626 RepID=UPI0016522CFC|nr:hypothetical protein [Trebonia kvetii]
MSTLSTDTSPGPEREGVAGGGGGQLDGSRAARVAMLASMTREELEAVGGVQEDD